MKKYQRSSRRESRSKGSASSFSERCYVLFSPALLYRQNILRCTFNIARCTQHVHCYHALDQHGFSLPCILSAFSKHHPPPPVTMHKLSMATRCHACTQHFSNITDKHPPVTIHNLHMTTSSQLVAMPTLSIFQNPPTNIISLHVQGCPSPSHFLIPANIDDPMTYASCDTSQHAKSWGQPPAHSASGSRCYTVLLLAPRSSHTLLPAKTTYQHLRRHQNIPPSTEAHQIL